MGVLRALTEIATTFRSAHVLVLCYHQIRMRERFADQMAVLAERGYSVLSLSQFTEWLNGARRFASPAALLTFDGCYSDQLENAVPVLDSLKFLVNVASFLALRLAGGWGLVSSAGSRVSPLVRALLATLDQPAIQVGFVLSAASCIAVLWWLRPRSGRGERGLPHVGVLGF